jgi:hypothetical protein
MPSTNPNVTINGDKNTKGNENKNSLHKLLNEN